MNLEPHTDLSSAQPSEVPFKQQPDPSPRPSPTPIVPDSIPEPTDNAQSEGRTREMVDEDKEIVKVRLSAEGCKGTEEKVESTAGQIEGTEDQSKEEIATPASQASTQTPTSIIFGDDENNKLHISQMKSTKAAFQKKKMKGIELMKQREEVSMKRRNESEIEDEISSSVKKFKHSLRCDGVMARKIQEEWETEEERNRIAEEEATNEAIIKNFDDIKARIEADRILAEKLQEQEREQFTIRRKEQKSSLGDLIVIFNPEEQDEFWNSQHEWNINHWKLHSSSGVHTLMTDEGLVVHMLIEKKYPLKKEIVVQMLKLKLESEEESTMAWKIDTLYQELTC
ncbi:hypothetical protein Tco_1226913 [Tanacetum coccineum]